MNKADIARHVYERCPALSKAQAQAATDAALDAIGLGLLLGGDVRIADLGSFRTVERAARVCRDPRTGGKIHVPPRRKIIFKPGRALLRALNNEETTC